MIKQTPQDISSNYHDLAGLDKLRKAGQQNDKNALKQAAQQFESMFMKMLMQSMRQANEVFEAEGPFNSQSVKFYQDMHDNQMAINLSSSGTLGLADLIVAQLGGGSDSITPANLLSPGGRPDFGYTPSQPQMDKGAEQVQSKELIMPVRPKATAEVEQAAERPEFASPESFVAQLLPMAKKVAMASGLNPLAMVAQAALETGWGQKMINKLDGSSSFNLFGIKADQRWQGEKANVSTLEYRDGVAKRERAQFRAYNSLEDSLKDYASFITGSPRYQNAVAVAQDAPAYANELQQAGYATDPAYAKKISSILSSDTFKQARIWLKEL